MCGIIGYTGSRPAGPIILDGLRRLEYRGYDSAGIALFGTHQDFYVAHATGKLDALLQRVEGTLPPAVAGLGHTRWATHGEPADRNAHPQLDPDGRIAAMLPEDYRGAYGAGSEGTIVVARVRDRNANEAAVDAASEAAQAAEAAEGAPAEE